MNRDLSALSISPERRAKKGPPGWLIALIAVCALLAAAVIIALTARGRAVRVEYAVARAAGSGTSAILNASGYVTPRRRATISSKITGKIKEVLVEEGMSVSEGQVLAYLDDADALASLRAAEAERDVTEGSLGELESEYELALKNLERARELRRGDLNSEQELDNAETAVRSLRARLEVARLTIEAARRGVTIARRGLENCTIRAPFSGVVVSKDAQPGEMVSPVSAGGGYTRTGIATVVDMASLEIEVDVNESYIARVSPAQRVEAVLDAYPDWMIPASVLTVIPTADRQKATVQVRIAFDELDPRILPDMGVKVSFLESGDGEEGPAGGVFIPSRSVKKENGSSVIFVIRDSTVERRAVTPGRETGSDILIVSGIRPGERVAAGNIESLRDGARIEIVKP
ncbi:MAG: efflux RND transporter periplasmic adaptor subunit [Candidatus Krumholzibacteriota bacterium]|nr:efflux RND transporter periplasmic adaptor subunit [Candidatus Krumholzibacteriota bacterium]